MISQALVALADCAMIKRSPIKPLQICLSPSGSGDHKAHHANKNNSNSPLLHCLQYYFCTSITTVLVLVLVLVFRIILPTLRYLK